MQPYRVHTHSENDGNMHVLCAMMSVNNYGDHSIFVMEKFDPDITPMDEILHISRRTPKQIAHMQTTKRNSTILAGYTLQFDMDTQIYHVYTQEGFRDTGISEYTQQDCLSAILEQFCMQNGHQIVAVL